MHKYMRLYQELESAIQGEAGFPGGRLPSVRVLAGQYRCSKSTVLAALAELERQHLIYAVPRSGYYVVQTAERQEESGSRRIDFASSAPDPDVFPYRDFQHCINMAIDRYKKDLFIYGTSRGLPSLITLMRKRLTDAQVFTPERSIVMTSGVQQALAVLAMMPFPGGRETVLIEQPGYHLFIEHLQTHGIPVRGITRTAEGVDMDELERLFRSGTIKFFYTMPRLHNPLGTSYTKEQKKRVVELALKHNVYLVEDDYMADLDEDRKADPLFAYGHGAQIVYLRSFSKIIFPGLRVGAAVLPDSLVETFCRYKRTLDIDTSMLSQGALEIYFKSGMFERHRQKISNSYAERARELAACLKREEGRCMGAMTVPRMKYPSVHIHVMLGKDIPVSRVLSRLRQQSVLVEGMDMHYLQGFPQAAMIKLNVTNTNLSDIDTGIRLLGDVLLKR
ncbi:aminotransferase-like domain-containing protein [Paenibacillus tarimensis]|uniref:aminotransferase-like domain-containing protein n=1 Tax=Paenibacillus tarimensis TaxID=416012 RepID=UPI001F327B78|nr:PLP-dependent aminotransferase family protein [Paenibacillus tarimensis]MCF2945339.1 PLP-dependent aminotransferase family protein [Paenibacillus tarimensis]